jgi:hypothetical protein
MSQMKSIQNLFGETSNTLGFGIQTPSQSLESSQTKPPSTSSGETQKTSTAGSDDGPGV